VRGSLSRVKVQVQDEGSEIVQVAECSVQGAFVTVALGAAELDAEFFEVRARLGQLDDI
jgi:hypothetical protein